MKISLCVITGNCQNHVTRFLDSFAPAFDELSLIRAIGSLEADDTVPLAIDWCERNGKPIRFRDYLNKEAHSDWPHVDNFAAARQLSFDQATHPLVLWADMDDVLERGAEYIRLLAQRGGYPCFMFPYKIFGRGVTLPRERLVLPDCGAWKYPVHECFVFHVQPVQGVQDDRVLITHLPDHTERGSNTRNLRILESMPESELNGGLLYHLHGELALAGRNAESVAAAQRALACADLGKPERYEIFLNLARMSDNPNLKSAYLHQAFATDPTRREALGLLSCNALDALQPEAGLAYARQMAATPEPQTSAWNSRAAAYSWIGDDFMAQALRANGLDREAEEIRHKSLMKHGGPRIALIHATRGRPHQASVARKIWLDSAEKPEQVEHIFVFDSDDLESRPLRRMHHLEIPAGGGCVAAWNHGAFAVSAPILVQMSDDWIPPARWDQLIIERFVKAGMNPCSSVESVSKDAPLVLAVSDGLRSDDLLCMAIMNRAYWAQDFFMFHPWFTGVYSDNWFTECAHKRKAIIDARDLLFEHRHFLKTGEEPDETYRRQNDQTRYEQGKGVLDQLQAGSDWSSVPGWFNFWTFYEFIARQLKDGDTVAEIGVWLGRSIIYLAQECRRLGKKVNFIAVDTFHGEANQPDHAKVVAMNGGSIRAAFEANLARCGVADSVRVVEGSSCASASGIKDSSLAFAFIDAAHDYDSVLADIKAWLPKVKKGGIIAGHDALYPPVKKAVLELLPQAQILPPVWIQRV